MEKGLFDTKKSAKRPSSLMTKTVAYALQATLLLSAGSIAMEEKILPSLNFSNEAKEDLYNSLPDDYKTDMKLLEEMGLIKSENKTGIEIPELSAGTIVGELCVDMPIEGWDYIMNNDALGKFKMNEVSKVGKGRLILATAFEIEKGDLKDLALSKNEILGKYVAKYTFEGHNQSQYLVKSASMEERAHALEMVKADDDAFYLTSTIIDMESVYSKLEKAFISQDIDLALRYINRLKNVFNISESNSRLEACVNQFNKLCGMGQTSPSTVVTNSANVVNTNSNPGQAVIVYTSSNQLPEINIVNQNSNNDKVQPNYLNFQSPDMKIVNPDVNYFYATGITKLRDLVQHIVPNSVVFLDLDDTLTLLDIATNTRSKIEGDINEILDEMRAKGAIVVVCSTRSFSTINRVFDSLNQAGINMNHENLKNIPSFKIKNSDKIAYSSGVFCCPAFETTDKDTMRKEDGILHFIDALKAGGFTVNKVLFADDNEDYPKDVHEKLKAAKIESAVFQYQEGLNQTLLLNQKYDNFQGTSFANEETIGDFSRVLQEQYGLSDAELVEAKNNATALRINLKNYLLMQKYGLSSVQELTEAQSTANQIGATLEDYLIMMNS